MLTNNVSDFVKIVDFGIAKILPQAGLDLPRLTQTGELFGSPVYMSPEQCQSKELTERSDVYAMGCVMYEALTGKPPFVADNLLATVFKQCHEDPKPFARVAAGRKIPAEVEAVIFRAMEKDPDKRYRSAEEMRDNLHYYCFFSCLRGCGWLSCLEL